MATNRSSSKRKSSRRKSFKLSSEARRKKRSRRNKVKKLRHQDDSSSYSSDDSRSSVSISSSSSKDECCRARSRTRDEVKSSKKRTRRSSSSSGSDDDSRHVKKKRRSKRSSNSDTKKKSQKKKRRREPSVSSISSDSHSGESEFGRSRGRSRRKGKDQRDRRKAKSGLKSNKNRSRSCSSCSRYSGSSGYSGKNLLPIEDNSSKNLLPVENNSRRLRSVIAIVKSQAGEEREWDNDGHKDEIAYDHDDYLSCPSNDSNYGFSKRELDHHSNVDLERTMKNRKGDESLVADIRITELAKDSEGGTHDCRGNSRFTKENKGEDPTIPTSGADELESILRLKALENLRKYRDGVQTKAKPPGKEINKSDSDVKQLTSANVEFAHNMSPREDDSRAADAARVLDQTPRSASGSEKLQREKGNETVSVSAARSASEVAVSHNLKEKEFSPAGAFTSKSEIGQSGPSKKFSSTVLKQTPKANMTATKSSVNNSSVGTSEHVGHKSNDNRLGVNDVLDSSISELPSSLKSSLEEHGSKEQHAEDKEGSQYEQKTMSVVRGGEMVQVSYKVYIPKKALTLARRQLRR